MLSRRDSTESCSRSLSDASRRRVALAPALAALAALALLGAGCGGDNEARSEQRPPVPLNVSVQIGTERITTSPSELGAGPATLLVTNQSGASQTLKVDGPRLSRSIGPIPPNDTATVKITTSPGDFTISAEETSALRPATLTIGPPRGSAQNDLLLP
jgi:hypothetical protein